MTTGIWPPNPALLPTTISDPTGEGPGPWDHAALHDYIDQLMLGLQTLLEGYETPSNLLPNAYPLPTKDASSDLYSVGVKFSGVAATDTASFQGWLNECAALGITCDQTTGGTIQVIQYNAHSLLSITGSPTGGTYTLTVTIGGTPYTTAALGYNATAAQIETAITAVLPAGYAVMSVTGSTSYEGGTFRLWLQGALVPGPTVTPSLTGGTSPTATVTTELEGITFSGSVHAPGLTIEASTAIAGSVVGSPMAEQLQGAVIRGITVVPNGSNNAGAFRYASRTRFIDVDWDAAVQHTFIEGDTNCATSEGNVFIRCGGSGANANPGYAYHWKANATDSMHFGGWGGGQECAYWITRGDHVFWNTHPVLGQSGGAVGFSVTPHPGTTAQATGVALHSVRPDTVNLTQHASATAALGASVITDPLIAGFHEGMQINDVGYAGVLGALGYPVFVGAVTPATPGLPGGTFVPVTAAGTPVTLPATGATLAGLTLYGTGINVAKGTANNPGLVNVIECQCISPTNPVAPQLTAASSAASTTTFTVASIAGIAVGDLLADITTPAAVAAGTTVTAVAGPVGGQYTITTSASTTIANADQLAFGGAVGAGAQDTLLVTNLENADVGAFVNDATVPGSIPANTVVKSVSGPNAQGVYTLTLSANLGASVDADTINFATTYGVTAGPNTAVNVVGLVMQSDGGQPYQAAFGGDVSSIEWFGLQGASNCIDQQSANSFPVVPGGDLGGSSVAAAVVEQTSATQFQVLHALGISRTNVAATPYAQQATDLFISCSSAASVVNLLPSTSLTDGQVLIIANAFSIAAGTVVTVNAGTGTDFQSASGITSLTVPPEGTAWLRYSASAASWRLLSGNLSIGGQGGYELGSEVATLSATGAPRVVLDDGSGNVASPGRITSTLAGSALSIAGALATAGPPTAGTWKANDVVLDATGALWLCTAPGTPGAWGMVGAGPPAVTFGSAAGPLTNASPATAEMAGLGLTLTPKSTGKVLARISGLAYTATAIANFNVVGRYGTGSAPTAGAAVAGTLFPQGTLSLRAPSATTGTFFEAVGVLTGLTVGTAYWFDLAFWSGASGDDATLENITALLQECS